MDRNRLWIIGSVLVMALVLAGGWIVGVQPQLAAISDAQAQIDTVNATNARNEQVLAQLKKDSENLPDLKKKLETLTASVPDGARIPPFVDQLNALYASSGVVCVDQSFADAVAYKPVVAPAAAAPAPTSTATPAPTPTPVTSPSATQAPVAGVPPVVNSLITANNFAAQPVSMTVRGQYSDILTFVKGLQSGARLFLVTALSTSPTTGTGAPAGSLDAKVSGYIYSLTPATASTGQGGTVPSGSSQTSSEASASK